MTIENIHSAKKTLRAYFFEYLDRALFPKRLPLYRRILPRIMATLTGKPRLAVHVGENFDWNRNVWSYNIFRVYEILFGREANINPDGSLCMAIRAEGASGKNADGSEWHVSYTWENSIVRFECWLRALAKVRIRVRLNFPEIRVFNKLSFFPQLVLAGNGRILEKKRSPFLFAIALDVASGFSAYSDTLAHTITGSNPLLYAMSDGDGQTTIPDPWTCTWGGVSMSDALSGNQDAPGSDRWKKVWLLGAAATGSANIVAAGSTFNMLGAISYSGAQSSSTKDSGNVGTGTADPLTVATTVVASNCWLVGTFDVVNAAGSGTTMRGAKKDNFQNCDSNGTVSTGSQSLSVDKVNSGNSIGLVLSIAPYVAPLITDKFFPFFWR